MNFRAALARLPLSYPRGINPEGQDWQRRASLAIALGQRHAQRFQPRIAALILLATIGYVVSFESLYEALGPGVAALTAVPVSAAGVLLGGRSGLVASGFAMPINALLFARVGAGSLEALGEWLSLVVASLSWLLTGLLGDALHHLKAESAKLSGERRDLEKETHELNRAEKALRVAQKALELRIEEQTADLLRTNAALRRQLIERTRVEQDLQDKIVALNTLSKFAQKTLTTLSVDTAVEHAMRTVQSLYKECTALVAIEENGVLLHSAAGGPLARGFSNGESVAGAIQRVVGARFKSIDQDSIRSAWIDRDMTEMDVHCLIGAVIIVQGEPKGCVCLLHDRSGPCLSATDLSVLELVATHLSLSLESVLQRARIS